MKVLVACEFSGTVRDAFRKLGHDAWSCDLLPTDIDPTYHIQGDAIELIEQKWDMIIAFPPCTYLTNAGAMRLRINGQLQSDRMALAIKAKELFMKFYNASCNKVIIENPVPGKIHELPKYNQIIEPYMFGEPWKKRTCLWLRGVPKLIPTNIVNPKGLWVGSTSSRRDSKIYSKYELTSLRDSKRRSKTFQGIADAMAQQWGGHI